MRPRGRKRVRRADNFRTTMDQLPLDVIYRIADRLPLKCLAMFRCLRKEWYTDPFLKTRMTVFFEKPTVVALDIYSRSRGPDREPVFEVDIDRNLVKASIPQLACVMRPRLMGTCNGLMCFLEDNAPGNVLILVNPLLEEVLSVSTPPPPEEPEMDLRKCRWPATGLGLDHVSGVYKLVVFLREKILVFDFYTRSWRETSSSDISPWGVGIFLGRTLYWQRCQYRRQIVSFNVAKEDVRLLSCPIPIHTLFDLGNHLGVAAFNQQAKHIYICEFNLHKKRWTNKYNINSPLLIECSSLGESYDLEIIGSHNEKILFKSMNSVYSYDPRSRKLECLHPKGM